VPARKLSGAAADPLLGLALAAHLGKVQRDTTDTPVLMAIPHIVLQTKSAMPMPLLSVTGLRDAGSPTSDPTQGFPCHLY